MSSDGWWYLAGLSQVIRKDGGSGTRRWWLWDMVVQGLITRRGITYYKDNASYEKLGTHAVKI